MSLADDVLNAAAGTVTEYAGIKLPAGYLWANGAQVSRTTYARLFAALTLAITGTLTSGSASITAVSQDLTTLASSMIGAPISGTGIPSGATISAVTSTTITLSAAATASGTAVALCVAPYGVGDGSTTFNVPDRRGRAGVGHDLMGTTAAGRLTAAGGGVNGALLGNAAGTETQLLTTAQMPAHTHANTLTDPGHTHAPTTGTAYTNGGAQTWGGGTAGNIGAYAMSSSTTGVTITNASQGGGSAHPNVQPSIVMNYIIKT